MKPYPGTSGLLMVRKPMLGRETGHLQGIQRVSVDSQGSALP